jgi:hypothetical protein
MGEARDELVGEDVLGDGDEEGAACGGCRQLMLIGEENEKNPPIVCVNIIILVPTGISLSSSTVCAASIGCCIPRPAPSPHITCEKFG